MARIPADVWSYTPGNSLWKVATFYNRDWRVVYGNWWRGGLSVSLASTWTVYGSRGVWRMDSFWTGRIGVGMVAEVMRVNHSPRAAVKDRWSYRPNREALLGLAVDEAESPELIEPFTDSSNWRLPQEVYESEASVAFRVGRMPPFAFADWLEESWPQVPAVLLVACRNYRECSGRKEATEKTRRSRF